MSRQSSDSKYKKTSSKPQGDGQPSSEGAGLRPSNVLPVRKKEKSRVRPFKSGGGVSPTQPGPTLSKKSGGTGSSQGAGDLFRVDPEGGGGSHSATPVGAEGMTSSHPRTVTPPVPPSSSKKSAKLKKRHSHHSSLSTPTVPPAPHNQGVTTPTNDALPGNTLPSGGSSAPHAMRKSNSVQSSFSLSSSSSSSHHRHRKQSTSTTGTTSTVHSSSAKKHGNSSSQLSSSLSHPSLSSVKTTTSSTEATAFRTDPTVIDNPPSSLPPPSTSSSVMATGKSDNASNALPTLADEKQAKRKRKKRREREKGQEAATGSEVNRHKNPDKNLEIKSEPSDHTKTASQLIHSSDRTERQNLEQEATKSLSNLQLLSGEETRVPSKGVKLEKIGKPRPSNLTIE